MLHWKFNPLALCIFAVAVIFSHAQDQPSGFISIDCGLPPQDDNYQDAISSIQYSTDAPFIDTGESFNIARDYISNSLARQLWTVRSFPHGARNCYNLTAMQVNGTKYLIRATFMYGNYDGKNQTTTFDLHLGVERWDTVKVNDSTSVTTKEIIHVTSSNYFYVCLVDLGKGTPFISTLEFRRLNQTSYPTTNSSDSLATFVRKNFAPADPNQVIRFPDDIFDRLWQPYATPQIWAPLSTTLNIDVSNAYQPPPAVMQTAVTPQDANQSLQFYWRPPDPNAQFYVYMHFAEVVRLQSNDYREFYLELMNQLWFNEPFVPTYLFVDTIYATAGLTEASFDYSLVKTENSTLPPIINAVEVYSVKQFLQSQTDENDVWAILNVKSAYGVNRSDWQGDPCFPVAFMWDGLGCIIYDNQSAPPRITSLNLSSSELTGSVSLYLSNVTFLENLDLSNNSLNGPIPDFLADLPQLQALNLSGNQFSGLIPQKLLDKAKSGLDLRADGYLFGTPNPCEGDQCNRKKSKKFLVPLVVSLATAALIILAALIVIFTLRMQTRRTKKKVETLGSASNRKDGFLKTKNMQYTYSDILKMTNNFQRVLGRGAFGTVYYGVADGKQVAVKLLSEPSAQGYHEFHSEAELLTRVHHRNLTSLVGYCYEDTRMALIYELMVNGNLREHLSVRHDNVLSWSQRLQIALDAAQGLDYLHNHCVPAIVHRDIKSTNILLNEKFEAKLADFGLSRVFSGSAVITRVVGTPGYLDPEYHEMQMLHEKSDIYSFGIVILELITGRPVMTRTEDKRHILPWAKFLLTRGDITGIVDPKLRGMYAINSVWSALELAMACASPTSVERPTMAHVLTELAECLASEKARAGVQSTDSRDLLTVNSRILDTGIAPR